MGVGVGGGVTVAVSDMLLEEVDDGVGGGVTVAVSDMLVEEVDDGVGGGVVVGVTVTLRVLLREKVSVIVGLRERESDNDTVRVSDED